MIDSMKDDYDTWKDVENLWIGDPDVRDFDSFGGKYEKLRERWIAGDTTVRREFIALESAKINDVLQAKVDDVQMAKYEAGFAIVFAAGLTAGLADAAAAPFLVTTLGADWGVAAGYVVSGLAFTTSDRFFQSAVTGDWTSFKNIWNQPLDYAEEVAFNAGMF